MFSTLSWVSEVLFSVHTSRNTTFQWLERGSIQIRNFSDFCHKGQQSLLEIWFSVFCNSFMSVWGACSITCRETFSIILASKGIHKFAIFVYIFLNLSGKHQLWPHRTPTTSWKFGFLFFGESSGEFKVVIYSLIWTNYWLQGL